jgi:hypothetical protein
MSYHPRFIYPGATRFKSASYLIAFEQKSAFICVYLRPKFFNYCLANSSPDTALMPRGASITRQTRKQMFARSPCRAA